VAAIESRFRAWVASQPLDADVDLLERSFVLDSAGWQRWWAENHARIEWSDVERRYRPRATSR
jgi:hypothetical protein